MVRLTIFIGSILLASNANAQVTTTCSGNEIVTCYSNNLPRTQGRSERSAAENIVNMFRSDPKRKAGKMLAKGDCAGAINVALQSGDLEFATQVRDYCASTQN